MTATKAEALARVAARVREEAAHNPYSFDLRWERVRALAVEARAMWTDIEEDLLAFAAALDATARA